MSWSQLVRSWRQHYLYVASFTQHEVISTQFASIFEISCLGPVSKSNLWRHGWRASIGCSIAFQPRITQCSEWAKCNPLSERQIHWRCWANKVAASSQRGKALTVNAECPLARLHVGVCGHGGLHQARLSPDAADRGGLQSGREHRLQVPGRKHDEPGASAVLRQRVPGLQRSQVGSSPLPSPPLCASVALRSRQRWMKRHIMWLDCMVTTRCE